MEKENELIDIRILRSIENRVDEAGQEWNFKEGDIFEDMTLGEYGQAILNFG